MAGSRLNRSLYYLMLDCIFDCPICGQPHVHHDLQRGYRAIEIAPEPVTDGEDRIEAPENTVFRVGEDYRPDMMPLIQKCLTLSPRVLPDIA